MSVWSVYSITVARSRNEEIIPSKALQAVRDVHVIPPKGCPKDLHHSLLGHGQIERLALVLRSVCLEQGPSPSEVGFGRIAMRRFSLIVGDMSELT